MDLIQDGPHLKAHCRDGSAWVLGVDVRVSFLDAWTAGRPFWGGTDPWGRPVTVKLADITGLTEHTAASIAIQKAEHEEIKRRELTGTEA